MKTLSGIFTSSALWGTPNLVEDEITSFTFIKVSLEIIFSCTPSTTFPFNIPCETNPQ
ncbi:MAG TPA: hypothetical protein PKZ75_14705 [Bacteroidia bacterium]|nr:hypothetical protein [Bacteroidia bacterium]